MQPVRVFPFSKSLSPALFSPIERRYVPALHGSYDHACDRPFPGEKKRNRRMTAWLVSKIYQFGAILSDIDVLYFLLYEVLRIV